MLTTPAKAKHLLLMWSHYHDAWRSQNTYSSKLKAQLHVCRDGGRAAALSSDFSSCFPPHSHEAAAHKPIMDNKHITAQRAAPQLISDFNCFWRRTLSESDWSDTHWCVWHQTLRDTPHLLLIENDGALWFKTLQYWVTLYFKVSLLQCNYTFKYWVILINYMYLLYG